MNATTRKEYLEARVRETNLRERLEQSQKRIGSMCSEGRSPKMSIPVQYTDDDFFICTTLRDAVNTFDQAREALKLVKQWKGAIGVVLPTYVEEKVAEALAAMEAAHEL